MPLKETRGANSLYDGSFQTSVSHSCTVIRFQRAKRDYCTILHRFTLPIVALWPSLPRSGRASGTGSRCAEIMRCSAFQRERSHRCVGRYEYLNV